MSESPTTAPPPPTKPLPTTAPTKATPSILSTLNPSLTTQPQTTATTTTTTTTGSCPCVLASTLSATFVIIALIICGVLYYFYQRRKEKSTAINSPGDQHTLTKQSGPNTETPNYSRYKEPRPEDNIPPLPIKPGAKNQKTDYQGNQGNQGLQSDEGYCVPPKREEPLPRKKGKKKEGPKVSPYHGSLRDQEEYSVPPTRPESFTEPPLPPNLAKKLKRQTELESARPESATNSDYYLDMEGIKDELYQNVGATNDDIYINS